MPDIYTQTSTTVVEVLIPGPQGPSGVGTDNIGGYPVAVDSIEADHVLAFNGTTWHNKPLAAGGDMTKAVYDSKNDGKVNVARVAEAVAWSGITSVPASFMPAAHTHVISDITDLSDALDHKASVNDLAVLTGTVSGKAPLASPEFTGSPKAPTATSGANTTQIATTAFVTSAIAAITPEGITWTDISDKPSTFAPSAHTHAIIDVTGLSSVMDQKAPLASPALTGTPSAPTATSGTNTTQIATTAFVTSAIAAITPGGVTWADISGKPTTFTPSTHTHAISDVTGLSTVLDAKASLASPTLTGTPSAPTASAGTNTTQVATTAFVTTATTKNVAVITTSGNFTVPAGIRSLDVQLWGGGGGGGGNNMINKSCGGGGGGGYARGILTVTPGQVVSATVGAGGAGGPAGSAGGIGGTSSFLTISASGGAGAPASHAAGSGGSGSGGTINLAGGGGGSGTDGSIALSGNGGGSPMGSVGGGVSAYTGLPGAIPGGGGSGGGGIATTNSGGAGAAGLIIITY